MSTPQNTVEESMQSKKHKRCYWPLIQGAIVMCIVCLWFVVYQYDIIPYTLAVGVLFSNVLSFIVGLIGGFVLAKGTVLPVLQNLRS